MKKTITLQDKIDLIVEHTMFTPDDVLKLPAEAFDTVYEDVMTIIVTTRRIEAVVSIYGAK